MRFPPVEDIPDIDTTSININKLDRQMNELIQDVRFAVTHDHNLRRRCRELSSSLDDLLVQHLHTHESMRILLRRAYRQADYPIVSDTASLAREQVEKLYQAVILLQGPYKWIRQALRNAWQKDYERYLLELDEYGKIERYKEFIYERYPEFFERQKKLKLRPSDSILVSDFAIKVIEYDWHNRKMGKPTPKPTWFTRRGSIGNYLKTYFYFPTPWDVMTKTRNKALFAFLDRWYREYKMLSAYSHVLIEKVVAQRAGRDKGMAAVEKAQVYGRKKAETFIIISNVAAASLCAIIIPHLGNTYGSKVTTREYWEQLYTRGYFPKALWKLYAEKALR
ncbi:MAG: hypothetical protein ACJ74W_13340 [Pyrinomonadaceae bacterium]